MDRVVVTGMGAITPLGLTAAATWQAILQGRRAARDWDDLTEAGFRRGWACRITGLDLPEARRGLHLARIAATEALAQAGWPGALPDRRAGLFIGSTIGESAAFEAAATMGAQVDVADYRVPSFCAGLARDLNLTGPTEALATACAAGNYAIGAGLRALRSGRVPWALCGAVEPFSRLSMVGFSRSRAMATGDCHPFDPRRDGMVLGEGAAMFVLERASDALARGATPLAEVLSLGLASDAHHPTAPRPDGLGMARAMRAAINAAGLTPAQIDWVSLHGTGTRASDAAEGEALKTVFAGHAMPALSACKGAIGHGLGAASAIAAALCILGLRDQRVPPTAGHGSADPAIGLSCVAEDAPPLARRLQVCLNNGFAFGGLNSTLALARWEART